MTDRLAEVKRNVATVATYQYDPFGRRFSKRVNGELTYYLYSDEGLIAEFDEQGKLQVAYGWEPDSYWGTSPLWQANVATGGTLKTATYHYLQTDHLGTPQIATDAAGNITWQAMAEAFGETIVDPTSQITMNLRFPGQYYDAETETHYNYFRDYNPKTGRYQQSDPIGLGGGINFYVYVAGSPILYFDPYGLSIMDPVWGGIFWVTNGWSPSDSTVNTVAGFGDGLVGGATFGLIDGQYLRDKWDIGNVNPCSTLYQFGNATGTAAAMFIPIARLTYPKPDFIKVTRWGRDGLEAGDWVMRGGKTIPNYLLSFKWQPGMTNIRASFSTGKTFTVPRSAVKLPKGQGNAWQRAIDGPWKGVLFNQRMYLP